MHSKRNGRPLRRQQFPLSPRLLFSHYYPSSVAAEPKRVLFDVEIGVAAQRWKIGNEICGLRIWTILTASKALTLLTVLDTVFYFFLNMGIPYFSCEEVF